ncbi:MAG TPA: pilus assembly protein PilN [Chromatiales bacterium]|nr:pilus assembly protein PilN [Thiotrichales bacterium]HIP68779.1 pilus assembly protein PilN [Chromatiales bacterium]
MAHINLLPWREELRKKKQQEFVTLLALTALLGGLLVFAGHILVNNWISGQQAKNDYLKQEIKAVKERNKEITEIEKTRQALLDRMEVIQQLQASRPRIVHLFDEMVSTLPDGVFLTAVKQTNTNLEFSGKAESNARVSSHMRNINASEWMANSKLTVIQADEKEENSRIRVFTLTASQTDPHAEVNDEESEGGSK